jgi:two-component system, OmpR family, sensor kinase
VPDRPLLRWALALLPLAVGTAVWTALRSGLASDERIGVQVSALRSDWVLAAGALVSTASCLGVALRSRRDARWRRLLEERAAAATRDRRLLLSRLDHELKNPLTAMRAALANVSGSAEDADREAGLRSIESQVLRLSRLTADLRKIAELASSERDRRLLDVVPLLEEAVDIAREQAPAAERRLSVGLPEASSAMPPVVGDADLLTLAVVNLVDNAIKYTSAGDRIEVRARDASNRVVIEVADTGPGIPDDEVAHIWDELYRGAQARAVPGSGLGLALVRAVAEQHGGTVEVESWIGHGTVVRLLLPSARPSGA